MLKRQIKKLIQKRDNGETVLNLFPVVLTSLVVLALTILFTTWISNVNIKTNIDQVARKYMLKIETYGFLSAENEEKLLDELEEAGMIRNTIKLYNVERNGIYYSTTTLTDAVPYGGQIYLAITGEIDASTPKIWVGTGSEDEEDPQYRGFIKIIYDDEVITYTVIRGSTSKES